MLFPGISRVVSQVFDSLMNQRFEAPSQPESFFQLASPVGDREKIPNRNECLLFGAFDYTIQSLFCPFKMIQTKRLLQLAFWSYDLPAELPIIFSRKEYRSRSKEP